MQRSNIPEEKYKIKEWFNREFLQTSNEIVEMEPLLRPHHISSRAVAGERSKKRKVSMRGQEDLTAADPDLVFTASKFVKNILDKAKIEAAKRLKAQNLVSTIKILFFKKGIQ